MTADLAHGRPSVRRRWVRAVAVPLAAGAFLAGAAVSTSALASTVAAPSDAYTVCRPSPCMPIAEATVTGTVFWDANATTYRAQNNRLALATVWFTEIDNGRETSLPPIRVLRGTPASGTLRLAPATDALRVSLCDGASSAPTSACPTTTLQR